MSSLVDSFAVQNLPPKELWPDLINLGVEPFCYPDQLNCASELLDKFVSAGSGHKTLFYFKDEIWSYQDLLERSNRIANYLVNVLRLRPGNRVLLRGPNTPLIAACWFAVIKAGGICVTTMPLLRAKELSFICEKAEVGFALCDAAWLEELQLAKGQNSHLKVIVPFYSAKQSESLESLCQDQSTSFTNIETAAEDTALIAFTSGTTGGAKATMHFHRDVMVICDAFPRSILKPSSSDIFCGTPPFAFTFGLGALLLFPLRFGASSVLLDTSAPAELAKAIARHRVTIVFTSPTGYRAMAEHIAQSDSSSLKKCVSAGEGLPLATFEMWRKLTGISIIDGIGATELLHIFISATESEIRPGSTGKPLPGYEAKIIDPQGNELPNNTIGLLAVRGPTGCRYLNDARQRDYVKFGWNVTGDAYLRDADGYFWFQARADDMIISSGYNISGIEVENVILKHPKVRECAVVGSPCQDRGQIVKAFVVLSDPADVETNTVKELQDFVKSEIAPYKYPRAIEFCDALPKTETGKIQRFRLR